MTRERWWIPLVWLAGCAGLPPAEQDAPLTLVVSVPRGAIPENFALPYPNELWRRADGTLDLSNFPGAQRGLARDVALIAEEDGAFALHGGVYLHFEGALDPESLPDPAETLDPASPAFLVELRADGTLGERIPLLLRADQEGSKLRPDGTLVMMPVFGFSLRPGLTYAAVLTTALRGTDGAAALSSADFLALREPSPPEDPALAAADALYEPLFSALEGASLGREEVAWATVFRAGDPIQSTFAIHDFVFAGGAGVPAPSFSEAPLFTRRHVSSQLLEYRGQFLTPRLQAGEPPYLTEGGAINFDAAGAPIIQALDPVDVVITIPDQDPPAGGWPVVIYNHGTGGDAESFVGNGGIASQAGILGEQGFAVIGIDQPLHGARATPGIDVNIATFNPLNLRSTRDTARQSSTDNVQLLRIIEAGITLDREGQAVPLATGPVFFMGHSQGAISGPPFLAWAQAFGKVRAAVLSGPSGSLQLAITDRFLPLNGELVEARSFLATFIGEDAEALDELHPILSLAQQVIETEDPLSYGRFFRSEAAQPFDVLLTQGFEDVHTPPRTIDAIATAIGLAPAVRLDGRAREVLGLSLQGFAPLAPPFAGNEGVTAALAQFPDDDHFAIFDNPDAQSVYGHFLGTALRAGRAEVPAYGE